MSWKKTELKLVSNWVLILLWGNQVSGPSSEKETTFRASTPVGADQKKKHTKVCR